MKMKRYVPLLALVLPPLVWAENAKCKTKITTVEHHQCIPDLALSFTLNTNTFSGGDTLVLSCIVSNCSKASVCISNPRIMKEFICEFAGSQSGIDSYDCFFGGDWEENIIQLSPRTTASITNTYVVPENITLEVGRMVVAERQRARIKNHNELVPSSMTQAEFEKLAQHAWPTNNLTTFTFQTSAYLPVTSATVSNNFLVDIEFDDIPVREAKMVDP